MYIYYITGATILRISLCCVAVFLSLCGLFFYLLRRYKKAYQALQDEYTHQAEKLTEALAEQTQLQELLHLQERAVADVTDQMEMLRRRQHDYRQQVLALQEFAKSGKREMLSAYLPVFQLEDEPVLKNLCENFLVNTLAKHYFRLAEEEGIRVDAVLDVDKEFWLSSQEISTLFGNLFENAVTAAREAPEGERILRIRSEQREERFIFTMGNSFGVPRLANGDTFSSTKENHQGIGLSSIRAIAERYEGCASFGVEDNLFHSSIILFRPINLGEEEVSHTSYH